MGNLHFKPYHSAASRIPTKDCERTPIVIRRRRSTAFDITISVTLGCPFKFTRLEDLHVSSPVIVNINRSAQNASLANNSKECPLHRHVNSAMTDATMRTQTAAISTHWNPAGRLKNGTGFRGKSQQPRTAPPIPWKINTAKVTKDSFGRMNNSDRSRATTTIGNRNLAKSELTTILTLADAFGF